MKCLRGFQLTGPGPAGTFWITHSGRTSKGLYWDGESHWEVCLRYIKKLQPTIGEAETGQLLKRYYSIIEMAYGPEDDDKPITSGISLQVYEKVREFSEELKARLGQIDNDRASAH
jgi:hypothetical protein